jgi:dsDNA-specific endonuclease/ATPase MutS2
MAHEPTSRAAELAAQQVESIVNAAETAAEEVRQAAARQAEEILTQAQQEGQQELERARTQVVELAQEARRDAEGLVEEAKKESAQVREQTRRAVEGRVAAAEERAAEVMSEAEALSSGLRHLGQSLAGQGERILRDVQAAHRRMQADLRVGPSDSDAEGEPLAGRSRTRPRRTGSENRPAAKPNPFEDLDVPDWVPRSR